jgi:hypothetical protein
MVRKSFERAPGEGLVAVGYLLLRLCLLSSRRPQFDGARGHLVGARARPPLWSTHRGGLGSLEAESQKETEASVLLSIRGKGETSTKRPNTQHAAALSPLVGKVWHTRFQPTVHKFWYSLFFTFLDLDELPEALRPLWPLASDQWAALARFDEADHLKGTSALKSFTPQVTPASKPGLEAGAGVCRRWGSGTVAQGTGSELGRGEDGPAAQRTYLPAHPLEVNQPRVQIL